MIRDRRLERQKQTIQRQAETIKSLNSEMASLERDIARERNALKQREAELEAAKADVEKAKIAYADALSEAEKLCAQYKQTLANMKQERDAYRDKMNKFLKSIKRMQ